MATQYTDILGLALPVPGELSGTWGDVVNDNITSMVEQAIAGRAVINTWTTNNHTLTSADGTTAESRNAFLQLTDSGTALSGAGTVTVPAFSKLFYVQNLTAQIITVKTASGTGVAVAVNSTVMVACDGTNVVGAVYAGTFNGPVGNVTPSTVAATTLSASGAANLSGGGALTGTWTDLGTVQTMNLDGGTIDGVTIATSDITVGAGKTINVSAGSFTLADNQISGDKVEGGTIAAITITAMTGTLETAAQPNITSLGTIGSLVATTADINGGTIDGTPIGATTPSAIAGTTGTFSGNLSIGGGTPAAIEGLLVTKASGGANIIVQNIADLVSNEVVSFAASAGPRTKSGTVGVYKHAGIASSCAFIQLQSQDAGVNYFWCDDSSVFRTSGSALAIGTTSGTVVGTQTSDERVKTIIDTPFPYASEIVKQLEPMTYTLDSDPDGRVKLGFGAQRTRNLLPEVVYDTGRCIDGYTQDPDDPMKQTPKSDRTLLAMDQVQMIAVLAASLQEEIAKTEALTARLDAAGL